MLNKTDVFSIFNRVLALFSGLALVILNIHFVAVEGQGAIAIVNFGILIISTTSQFVGGGALIYLSKKYPTHQFHAPAIVWALISASLLFFIGQVFEIPEIHFIATLGFLQSLVVYYQMLHLAKARIIAYQWMLFTQSIFTPVGVFIFYSFLNASILSFCLGLTFSLTFTLLVVCFQYLKRKNQQEINSNKSFTSLFKDLLKYGGYNQLANLSHLGNQRIYIYLLESLLHQGYLFSGIFAIFLYLAEAIWTIGKSLSSVLTSLVAQSNDKVVQLNIFNKYLKLSIVGTLLLIVIAYLFPKQFLEPYFKQSSADIQMNLLLMSPAILVHSITTPISHFFSGIGLLKYNFQCALAGFSSGAIAAFYFIQNFELQGAFMAISIGFTMQCSLHVFYLMKWKSNLNRKDSELPLVGEE
ncbi:MAG: hypothetical protein ACKO7C_04405 [Bacteroidota bacterium]